MKFELAFDGGGCGCGSGAFNSIKYRFSSFFIASFVALSSFPDFDSEGCMLCVCSSLNNVSYFC